ncbi:MAG: phosphatidylserine decarboxylase family protein [Rickettsiales bacterium]|nr:phosphatidylserine decarboxylase family protein [Rickettsiales bacterium]
MNKDNHQPGKIDSFFDEIESLKKYIPPINSAGYPFIIIFIVLSLILSMLSDFLGWLGFVLTLWCVYFFRDPKRVTPDDEKIIVSPADGKILSINKVMSPENLVDKKQIEMKRISIFMDVFNVHVNRIPVSGKIVWLKYIPGAFFNASLDKSSEGNERMITKIEVSKDIFVYVVQIAGLVARRIKCDLTENQSVKIGDRFGIIRFGSRVDLYFPKEFKTNVFEGQTSISGETILADFKNIKSK